MNTIFENVVVYIFCAQTEVFFFFLQIALKLHG